MDHDGVGVGVGVCVAVAVGVVEQDGSAAVPAGQPKGQVQGRGPTSPPGQKKPGEHSVPVAFVEPPTQAHPGAAEQSAHSSAVDALTAAEKAPLGHAIGAPDEGGQ